MRFTPFMYHVCIGLVIGLVARITDTGVCMRVFLAELMKIFACVWCDISAFLTALNAGCP